MSAQQADEADEHHAPAPAIHAEVDNAGGRPVRRILPFDDIHRRLADLALARTVGVIGAQTLEFRLEAFNLFNTFNWGDPASNENSGGTTANLNSGTFGRITTQAGDPRIIQLGIKYAF